jgi:lipopolysaccharide/colanic/teichoic acid biosynthesis glycosyltransferase
VKRAVDVVLGSLLAIVAIPLIALLAVVVAVVLRCWPFFTQERVGRHGRPFKFVKIRTLPVSTPRYAVKSNITHLSIGRFSRFLRRRHLDELPQLFLVPLGKMSLVGPRPKMPDEHEPFDPQFTALRSAVRPGCTCLWQIGQHTDGLPGDAPEYDIFYLDNVGMRLDVWIMWRTLGKMFGPAEPVALEDVPQWASGRAFPHADIEPELEPQLAANS